MSTWSGTIDHYQTTGRIPRQLNQFGDMTASLYAQRGHIVSCAFSVAPKGALGSQNVFDPIGQVRTEKTQ